MSLPKLLFLCQTFPYPPDGGVWIRSFNILRLLAQEFDVTALCFERAVAADDDSSLASREHLEQLSRFADVEVFAIPQRHSRARYVADHLRSVALQRPFTRYLYRSKAFRSRLEQLLADHRFEAVHVDSMDLSEYLPLVQHLPVLCTHHNVESELLRRRVAVEKNPLTRAYVALQARLTRKEERRWCGRVDMNIAVSEEDAETLREIAPEGRYAVVSNGVDIDFFRPDPRPEEGLVFVGGATWFPNRDALGFFTADILPRIRQRHPSTPVRWVGAAREEDQRRFREQHDVDLTGYVDDIRPIVHGSRCYVVPLRVGGGSRLKILDAWAMGKAIVSTSTGCEGLSAVDGHNILIADTPEEFAAAVNRVLTDDELRSSLGRAGRQIAEGEYSWAAIGRSMLGLYRDAVAGRGVQPPMESASNPGNDVRNH